MKKFALGLMMMLTSAAALASGGTWSGVTVLNVESVAGSTGYVEYQLSGNSTGGANCALSNKNYVIIDVTTAPGAYAAAAMMSARLSGASLTIYGTGGCAVGNSSVETLYEVIL